MNSGTSAGGIDAIGRQRAVNKFSIKVATVNGSGSQTSNGVLLRALFKMGIPVTGKNLFPSNIHGMPTWYIIRLSRDGFLAHRDEYEIAVCMNRDSLADDVSGVAPGGLVLYDDSFEVPGGREYVSYYPMPVKQLIRDAALPLALRDYLANMIYVGILAFLLNIELDEIEQAISWSFEGKTKPIELNLGMVRRAYAWAEQNTAPSVTFSAARMSGFNEGKLLMDGNTAAALGSIFGGVSVVSWYPITPSSSIADALNKYLPLLRSRPDDAATYAVIQAEDEIAAAGMVVGAGWAGARAMTATSGPGLDLMVEIIGLAYFAEVPMVVWDVQRVGPSTGLPTRTCQGDIQDAYYMSHGDTKHVVLFPASPKECFDFGVEAFDLAEELQTPVIVLSDLDLGMNLWSTDSPEYPSGSMRRGKVLTAEDLERLGGEWARYRDVDGDGICYRTLPGTRHKAAGYFTRGTGHDERARYSERADDWEENLNRLGRKFETAASMVPGPAMSLMDGAQVGIISVGSNDPAVFEARDILRAEGIDSSYLRVRALPIQDAIRDFLRAHDPVFVVENNYSGQLYQILLSEEPGCGRTLVSVARSNGLPLTAAWISGRIRERLRTVNVFQRALESEVSK
jgi:2-oxoglutarate ferredoxin oxidoreductase subunit alpha